MRGGPRRFVGERAGRWRSRGRRRGSSTSAAARSSPASWTRTATSPGSARRSRRGPHRRVELRRGRRARRGARRRTVAPGEWITGRGWDQNRWADTRFPTHDELIRGGARTTRCSSSAWTATRCSPTRGRWRRPASPPRQDPAGGRIVRNADGSAERRVRGQRAGARAARRARRPRATRRKRRDARPRSRRRNRWGLTGVHDAGVSRDARHLRGAGEGRPAQPPRCT